MRLRAAQQLVSHSSFIDSDSVIQQIFSGYLLCTSTGVSLGDTMITPALVECSVLWGERDA